MNTKHIPSDKIEPILVKILTEDPKYLTLLSDHFKSGWLNDKTLDSIVNISLKYYLKYNKLPTFDVLSLIASKYLNESEYEDAQRKLSAIKDLDISEIDKKLLDDEIITYIQNIGMYNIIMDSLSELEKTKSIESCIDSMSKLLNASFDDDIGFFYVKDIDQHIEEILAPDQRISTGINILDKMMNGGPYKEGKSLTIFTGETHIGKSLMLSNIALNMAANGNFVIVYSMEMSELIYGQRIDAHNIERNINKLRDYTVEIKSGVNKLKSVGDGEILIKEFPSGVTTAQHLKNHCEKTIKKLKRKPNAIFVDYLALLTPSINGRFDGLYERVGRVATEVRALSYYFECPIISASQVNRAGYSDNQPELDKISDSMGVAHVADYIGMLWQNESDKELGILQQVIRKNRFGGNIGRNIVFAIDYDSLRIKDRPEIDSENLTQNWTDVLLGDLADL